MTKNNSIKIRISWVDICRGIGILLVMYGHRLNKDSDRFLIYAFHIPLFFFLSGIVFNADQTKHFLRFVIKSIRTILIPYVIFASLTVLLWFYHATHPSMQEIYKQMYGILYGNGNNGFLGFNVALWFLPCLFITKIMFGIIVKYLGRKRFIIPSLIIFSLIGYVFSFFLPEIKLPFGIETAFTAYVFFGAGYVWKQQKELLALMEKRAIYILPLCFLFFCLVASINYFLSGSQVDMRMNRLNNYPLFYLSAFSGIGSLITFSMLIGKNFFLEYIGKQSLILFACHYLLFTYFTDFLLSYANADVINTVKIFLPLIYTGLALYIILSGISLLKITKKVAKSAVNSSFQ